MIKNIFTTLFFLLTINLYSQDSDFEEFKNKYINKMSTEMCDCVANNKSKDSDEIMKCFSLKENKFGNKYDSLFFKVSQKKYKTYLEKLNNSIFFSLQEIMVRDCESYSANFKKFKERLISNIYKHSDKMKLDSLNNLSNISEEFLVERARYNLASKNFENAIQDIKKFITLNKYDKWGYLILAWIYEEKGDFIESIKVYNKFLDFNPSPEVKAYLEIAKLELDSKKN